MSKDSAYIQGLLSRKVSYQNERNELMETIKGAQEHLQTLSGAIAGIDQLLRLEGVKPEIPSLQDAEQRDQSLADVLKLMLSDRKPLSVEDIVKALQDVGFDFENKNPLRAVGFTLMGMSRGEKYVKSNDGRWRFVG